ncbi:MAG: hypothetical protein EZS28_043964 [Streblomastix strix]|uniref:Uncharacterized protein n=1 Tax=Streblomastix strix TaxID=222440 RepID=A0A5J4TRI2_9EUKA|nr:MAG: hypothetical protein EZS28_043964 [Streblomastix strix]
MANEDTIDKDQLDYEPIDNASIRSIAYGMYEQLIRDPNTVWQSGNTLISIVSEDIKPKFTGTTRNIPLNTIMFATKNYDYPICWYGAIPIDCYIEPYGHVIVNTMCQLSLPDDFCVQVCDSYAIHNN